MVLNIHSHSIQWWKKILSYISKFQVALYAGESFCIIKSRWAGTRQFQNLADHFIYDLNELSKTNNLLYCELTCQIPKYQMLIKVKYFYDL